MDYDQMPTEKLKKTLKIAKALSIAIPATAVIILFVMFFIAITGSRRMIVFIGVLIPLVAFPVVLILPEIKKMKDELGRRKETEDKKQETE